MTSSERKSRKSGWRVRYAIFGGSLFVVALMTMFATRKADPVVRIDNCVVDIKKSPAPVIQADGGMMLPKGSIVECRSTAIAE